MYYIEILYIYVYFMLKYIIMRRRNNNCNCKFISFQPGIILVHDLTNRKSQQNLQKWLEEVLNKDGTFSKSKSFDDFDPEKFVGSTHVKNFQIIKLQCYTYNYLCLCVYVYTQIHI